MVDHGQVEPDARLRGQLDRPRQVAARAVQVALLVAEFAEQCPGLGGFRVDVDGLRVGPGRRREVLLRSQQLPLEAEESGVLRVPLQPGGDVRPGEVVGSRFQQQGGPVDPGLVELRVELEHIPEVRRRGLGVAQLGQDVRPVEVGLGEGRGEPDGVLVVGQGPLRLTEVAPEHAPVEVVLGVVGVALDHRRVVGDGLGVVAECRVHLGPVVEQH